MKIVIVLFIMCIVHTVIAAGTICHKDEVNTQDIIISCSANFSNDENYLQSLETVFNKSSSILNQSDENRSVSLLLENNDIRVLKVLPKLSRITSLSFKHNYMVELEKGAFQNIPSLKSLDLSNNELTGEVLTKDIFRDNRINDNHESLPLEHLNLGNNKITYLTNDVFTYLLNLKSLDLSNNPIIAINEEMKKAFVQLKKLQVLSIAQAELSSIPLSIFDSLPIQKLYLNGNRFTRVPSSISQLSNSLWFLNLNNNPIEEINSDSFGQLSRLKELHLDGMENLSKINENAFSPLLNLKILQCSYNPNLEFIDPKAFNDLKNEWKLKELYINNNNLKYLSEDTVEWRKLNILNIRGNPWNCTCSLRWLFSFVKKRQVYNPEANIGIRCTYPVYLNNSSFMRASNVLQCKDQHTVLIPYHKTMYVIHCFVVALILCFMAYFLIKNIQKSNRNRPKSSSIVSTVKYERAQLCDLSEI